MPVDSPSAPNALFPFPRGANPGSARATTTALLTCVVLCLPLASPARAADESAAARYRQDMRDCREGRTAQSRADCEREARSAAAEARRGALATPINAASQAQQRCAVFRQEADHTDCMARMGVGARLSGSVEGGGVLREHTTVVPAR